MVSISMNLVFFFFKAEDGIRDIGTGVQTCALPISSSQQAAMEAWQAGFQGEHPDVQFSYDPAGSGAGREQFIDGTTDFAGSDAALDDEELAAAQDRKSVV